MASCTGGDRIEAPTAGKALAVIVDYSGARSRAVVEPGLMARCEASPLPDGDLSTAASTAWLLALGR